MPLAAGQGAWAPQHLSWGPGRRGQLLSPPLSLPPTPPLSCGVGYTLEGDWFLNVSTEGSGMLRITESENKLVVTGGEGKGGRDKMGQRIESCKLRCIKEISCKDTLNSTGNTTSALW